jgi:rubrerythrin
MVEESTLLLWLLIASLMLNLIIMVCVILLFRKMNTISSYQQEQPAKVEVAPTKQKNPAGVEGIVFCRNCGNQHDSIELACPNCKTPR